MKLPEHWSPCGIYHGPSELRQLAKLACDQFPYGHPARLIFAAAPNIADVAKWLARYEVSEAKISELIGQAFA